MRATTKHILSFLFFAITFTTSTAIASHAIWAVEEGQEFLLENYEDIVDIQPIEKWQTRKAKMNLIESDDFYATQDVELIEKTKEGQRRYHFLIDGKEIVFYSLEKKEIGCGSLEIQALNLNQKEKIHLKLIDHSQRHCKDLKPYTWKARLKTSLPSIQLHYEFVGNPF